MLLAAKNKNDIDRKNSSSGAIFPIIARNVIERGGTVYGAAFNNTFGVEHIEVNDLKKLPRLYGSKYVFSTCKVFPDIQNKLDNNILVLFSGTPCQVSGLKKYLKRDYSNLLAIDNICHGAPSQDIWMEYLNELANGRDIKSITFRSKEKGWRHYRMVINYHDGNQYNIDHDSDLYMRGFIDNLILQESCYYCKFKGIDNRKSDITLGDLWGVWDFLPEMYDDKGTSLLMINSEKGKKLLNEISDKIIISEVNTEQAITYNKGAIEASKKNAFRDRFMKEYYQTGNLIKCLKKYATPNALLRTYRKFSTLLKK